MHVSRDRGDTWTTADFPIATASLIGPRGKLYVAVENGGLMHSSDEGVSWEPTGSEPPASIETLRLTPAGDLIAGVQTGGPAAAGLYRSVDEGETWTRIAFGAIVDVLVRANEIFALTENGTLIHSTDAATFSTLGHVGEVFSDVVAIEIDRWGRALVGTVHDGVLRSKTAVATGVVDTVRPPLVLLDNYPDPFNSVTTISFDIPTTDHVSLEVYDILGRRVRTLVDGVMHAGRTNVNFYATDLSGGLYLYRLTFGQRRLTGTMILTK